MRQPEIGHLDQPLLGDQDVRGLQSFVEDAAAGRIVEGRSEMGEEPLDEAGRQSAVLFQEAR